MNWKPLSALQQIDQIIERSHQVPCLIFKHSTSCSISFMARLRLESDWNFSPDEIEPYFLDLLAFRDVSGAVARRFDIHHESPQVLLIHGGECVYDTSHLDITVNEIREALESIAQS